MLVPTYWLQGVITNDFYYLFWLQFGQTLGVPFFADGFESGNTSAWSATVPLAGGTNGLLVNAGAAMDGAFGLEITFNGGSNAAYVLDNSPTAETDLTARFLIDPQTLALVDGEGFTLYRVPGTIRAGIDFQRETGTNQVRVWAMDNALVTHYGVWAEVPPESFELEFGLALSGANGMMGHARITINGDWVSVANCLENASMQIETQQWGAVANVMVGSTCSLFLDRFEAYANEGPLILPFWTDWPTLTISDYVPLMTIGISICP